MSGLALTPIKIGNTWKQGRFEVELDEKNKLKVKVYVESKRPQDAPNQIKVDSSKIIYTLDPNSFPILLRQDQAAFRFEPRKLEDGTIEMHVHFDGAQYAIAASLRQRKLSVVQDKSAQKIVPEKIAVKAQGRLGLLSIKDARGLSLAIQRSKIGSSSLIAYQSILKQMVDFFVELNLPRTELVREMVTVGRVSSFSEQERIVKRLLKITKDEILQSEDYLYALAQMFRAMQRGNDQRNLEATGKSEDRDPGNQSFSATALYKLPAAKFINILKVLADNLNETSNASSLTDSNKLLVAQLEAFTAVLELMEMARVKNVERQSYHEPFYNALDRFTCHENLDVAFLAECGKQFFTHIPNNETPLHEFVRRATLVFQTIPSLIKAIKDMSPAGVVDGVLTPIKKAVTFQDGEKPWFVALLSLQTTFLREDLQSLVDFREIIDEKSTVYQEAEEYWHTHNPFLVRGLIDILRQVMIYHADENPEAGKAALLLLEQICSNNLSQQQGPFTIAMSFMNRVKQVTSIAKDMVDRGTTKKLHLSYTKQLTRQVVLFLTQCAKLHSARGMREVAQAIIDRLSQLDPELMDFGSQEDNESDLYTSSSDLLKFPTTLFEKAVKEATPWIPGYRGVKSSLESDPQFVYDADYYIEVSAEDETSHHSDKIGKVIQKFIDSDDKVLLIKASMGAGKSLSLKHWAVKRWKEYSPKRHAVFFASLPTLINPVRAVDEVLAKYKLTEQTEGLRNGKNVWILDGADELPRLMNFYQLNSLHEWKHSKLVVACRDEVLTSGDYRAYFQPDPSTTAGLREATINPFKMDERISKYLDQYVEVSQNHGVPLLWTKTKKYLDYFKGHESLRKLAEKPLFLRIIADTLPHVVALHKDDKSKEFVENDFLDALFCRVVERELTKFRLAHSGSSTYPKEQYLDYFILVARGMKAFSWLKDPTRRITGSKNAGQVLFSLDDEDSTRPLTKALSLAAKRCADDLTALQKISNQILRICGEFDSKNSLKKELEKVAGKYSESDYLLKMVFEKAAQECKKDSKAEILVSEAVKYWQEDLQKREKAYLEAEKACHIKQSMQELFQLDNAEAKFFRRCGFLISENGKWGFIHECFYSYFSLLGGADEKDHRNLIKQRLIDDTYGFGELYKKSRKHFRIYG